MKGDINDPKALIREAYNIPGITDEECRSIFFDWALSLPAQIDTIETIKTLLIQYPDRPDHPMTAVLKDGLAKTAEPKRRGGMRARRV